MKKTFIAFGTVATLTISSLFFTNPVEAQSLAERKANVEQKLSNVEKEIVNTAKKINELNEDVSILENAIKENNAEIKEIENKIAKNKKEIEKLEAKVEELELRIEKRNEILKNRLSALQRAGGNHSYEEVVFGSLDFKNFISRASASSAIAESDRDLILAQEKDVKELELAQTEVEKNVAEQEKQKKSVEDRKKKNESNVKELKKSVDSVKKEQVKLEEKKAQYVAEGNDIAALEARIQEQAVAATVVSSGGSSGNSAVASTSTAPANSSASGATQSKVKQEKPAVNLGGGSNGSALAAGRSVLGTPYRTAGKAPGGFDCSGFVAWAYKSEGINLPSYTGALAGVGQRVPSLAQAKPGDLVFFRGGAHVGIYMGGGKFIGSQTSTGVAVADLTSGYWGSTFDGHIRRVK